MSRTIVRDPDVARPWPPLSLRPPSPAGLPHAADAECESEATGDPTVSEIDTLLHSARVEAAELIRAAREEADRLRAAARQQGEQEARQEWEKQRARLVDLALSIGTAYERFCLDQVPALAELATLAAERLLGEQLTREPERVVAIVREAMDQVAGSAHVLLRLSPDDVELVQREFASNAPGHTPAVQIVPDPAVERGGCWIESEHGTVDATVKGRLSRLQSAMGDG